MHVARKDKMEKYEERKTHSWRRLNIECGHPSFFSQSVSLVSVIACDENFSSASEREQSTSCGHPDTKKQSI